MPQISPETELARKIGSFAFDPLAHAMFVYPWGRPGPLENERVRDWQGGVMKTITKHLAKAETRYTPLRIAIASGHGIGKSSLIGMISKWAMDCHVDARVVITANTEQQLITKTSPEVARWHKLAITRDWFKRAAMKISSAMPGHDDSWRLDLATWSANNTEAFAGLHNLGRIIVIVYDESAGIEDKVWEVTEGALTDEKTIIIWLAFGNPTKNTGRFRECFGRYRHLWITQQIDSRDVEGTNKEYLQSIVDTYGIDNDITKVRVLGQFPSSSSMQFIGMGLAEAARERIVHEGNILSNEPVIFGLDHARFGDDETVLAIRQGRDARSRPWLRWQGANSMQIAGAINDAMRRFLPDAVFIDAGGPNAGGVIDRLRSLNPDYSSIYEINFGQAQKEMTAEFNGEARVRVANKRAQMWQNMKVWLERGCIPDEQQLIDDLVAPEYGYTADNAILLEKKEHMKARGLASPDAGDALALTFAEHVEKLIMPAYLDPENYKRAGDFDRYEELPGYAERGKSYDRYTEIG